jgi:hypothetical protein
MIAVTSPPPPRTLLPVHRPRVSFCRLLLTGFCAMMLATACGCATAAVATAGTMAGIAASAISTGSDVYRLGKLDSADEVRYAQWITATRQATDDLGFTIELENDNGKGNWRCTIADDRKSRIRIYIDRRTETLCRTRIDVGIFGSEPTARLLLARIRDNAPMPPPKAHRRSTTTSTSPAN